MQRRFFKILFSICILCLSAPAIGAGQTKEQEPFQWLAAAGETSGIIFGTHQLQPLSLQVKDSPPAEIEQEEIKIDAQTTRVTRRVFSVSLGGERRLIETVIEEIRKLPGDRVRAMRTTSRRDANGRFTPVQQEIQEVVPSGADTFQIKRTILLPGMDNSLVEKERIQQTERRKGEAVVEIDRIRYVPGLGGTWTAAERRVSQNSLGKDQTRTEEQVYEYDVNNRLSLTQQIRVAEWKDASGRRQWQSETYMPNIDGKFRLGSRITVIQSPAKDGRQQTTELLEKPGPAAPNEGLRPVRRMVEDLTFTGPDETKRELQILEPGLNGGWRSIYGQQGVEIK